MKCENCGKEFECLDYTKDYFTLKYRGLCFQCWRSENPTEERIGQRLYNVRTLLADENKEMRRKIMKDMTRLGNEKGDDKMIDWYVAEFENALRNAAGKKEEK